MDYGFVRVASVVPAVNVADCEANVQHIIEWIDKAYSSKVQLVVFPELSITGYTCGDLFDQSTVLRSAIKGIEAIADAMAGKKLAAVVGAPIMHEGRLYNCAEIGRAHV